MTRKAVIIAAFLAIIAMLGGLSRLPAAGYTQIDLTEEHTGRKIFSAILGSGETAVLNWHNSLFDLDVTEGFRAEDGKWVQDRVIFADPRGLPPPEVTPADVTDLYHTGGPFTARALNKRFSRVVYRVSEIGNPRLTIRDHVVNFKQEVGFGGAVILTASPPRWYMVLLSICT